MNDVRRVECAGTCRIRVLPLFRVSMYVVEILELMSSCDTLFCGLISSANERDDIVSAGIHGQCEYI